MPRDPFGVVSGSHPDDMPAPVRLSQILDEALRRTSPCPHGHGPALATVAIPHAGDYLTRHRCHRCKREWTHEPTKEVAA